VGHDYDAAWSPDGASIAYTSDRGDRSGDLWVMRRDGSRQRKLAGSRGSRGPGGAGRLVARRVPDRADSLTGARSTLARPGQVDRRAVEATGGAARQLRSRVVTRREVDRVRGDGPAGWAARVPHEQRRRPRSSAHGSRIRCAVVVARRQDARCRPPYVAGDFALDGARRERSPAQAHVRADRPRARLAPVTSQRRAFVRR
jgi:dipeptidyl aminopeptidase/acylaminoacyl peptidase